MNGGPVPSGDDAGRGGVVEGLREIARRCRSWHMALIAAVVGGVLRIASTGQFTNVDASLWMNRSLRFSDALLAGDLQNATASADGAGTMPGIATMWIGTWARMITVAGANLGVWNNNEVRPFEQSWTALHIGQIGVAVVCAALVGLITYVVAAWTGNPYCAAFVGLFLAAEPWLVGLGAEFHTDELAAYFGVAGVVTLCYALGVPDRDVRPRHPVAWAIVGGALAVQAPLAKLTALGFVLAYGLIGLWALASAIVAARRDGVRPRLGATFAALGAMLVTVPIAYPAVLVDLAGQWRDLRMSADQGARGHPQFFLGEITDTPGALFYLVSLPWRATPWLVIGAPIGLVAAFVFRTMRWRALPLLVAAIPAAVSLSRALKQFDRYGLVFYVPLVVIVGLGLGALAQLIAERRPRSVTLSVTAVAAIGVVVAVAAVPYGIGYYNPLLGGNQRAEKNLLIGSGEGLPEAVELIERAVGGRCAGVTTSGAEILSMFRIPCAQAPATGERPRFSVLYISEVQRTVPKRVEKFTSTRTSLGSVRINGIVYATVWEARGRQSAIPPPSAMGTGSGRQDAETR